MIDMEFESIARGVDPAKQANELVKAYRRRGMMLPSMQAQLVQDVGELLAKTLREEAPRRSGLFADNIRSVYHATAGGAGSATISAFGEHAFLAEIIVKGTKRHLIQGKKSPLRFYWEGGPNGPGIYFYWSVMHPGTQPNDIVTRSLDREMPFIREAFSKMLMDVVITKSQAVT